MSAVKGQGHHETIIKKVSRKGDGGAHGGAWKVAFADFVLALMCLFMVLWILAAREQENLEQILRDGAGKPTAEGTQNRIEHNGSPPGSLIPREPVPGMGSNGKADSQVKQSGFPTVLDGQGRKVKKKLDSPQELNLLARMVSSMSRQAGLDSNLHLVVTPQGLRIMLHDTEQEGMFERGSAIMHKRFKILLQEIGALLGSVDNQILLIGHTDSMQYRSLGNTMLSNWSLSSNRAMSARLHLLDGGLPIGNVLQVVGMADRAPFDPETPTSAANRRIEMLVMTTEQAAQISNMFGAPDVSQAAGAQLKVDTQADLQPLAEGVGKIR